MRREESPCGTRAFCCARLAGFFLSIHVRKPQLSVLKDLGLIKKTPRARLAPNRHISLSPAPQQRASAPCLLCSTGRLRVPLPARSSGGSSSSSSSSSCQFLWPWTTARHVSTHHAPQTQNSKVPCHHSLCGTSSGSSSILRSALALAGLLFCFCFCCDLTPTYCCFCCCQPC